MMLAILNAPDARRLGRLCGVGRAPAVASVAPASHIPGVSEQLSLLKPAASALPPGLAYQSDLISAEEEQALVTRFETLELKPFEFRGYFGKRRVAYFGRRYDFNGGGLGEAPPLPAWLLPLRAKAAAFAELPAETLEHALVAEYAPGAPIGWHRDRPDFDQVVGVSLAGAATLRLRRRRPDGFDRAAVQLAARSAYILRGEVRSAWEHSIPPVEALRYSITLRSLSPQAAARSSATS